MHRVIADDLEQYMARTASARVRERLEAHLSSCSSCRFEVQEMERISELMSALKSEQEMVPPAGFSARVWGAIEAQRPAAFWTALFYPAFFRRTAFACLMLLALLGSYLVTRETQYTFGAPGPETAIAIEHNYPGPADNPAQDRDMMLVTLASYTQ